MRNELCGRQGEGDVEKKGDWSSKVRRSEHTEDTGKDEE